jgi:hypothetical protein
MLDQDTQSQVFKDTTHERLPAVVYVSPLMKTHYPSFPTDDSVNIPPDHILSKEDLHTLNTQGYLLKDNFVGPEKLAQYRASAKNLNEGGNLRLAKMGDDKW